MASLSNRKRGTVTSNDCGKEKQSTSLEVVSSEKGTAGERLPRAAKRRKNTTDSTNQTTESTSLPQKISVNQLEGAPEASTNRASSNRPVKRQAWTLVAINSFFEGLAEHGKAFERILTFMQKKQNKKQTDPSISNLGRNQVRFFYYRTWHKVSTILIKAQKELELQSPNKGGVAQAPSLGKSKKVKVNSDDEIEGEMIEGDVHFDTSLDEGEELADKPLLPTIEEETTSSLLQDNASPYNNPSSVEADIECDKDTPSVIGPQMPPRLNMAGTTSDNMSQNDCILYSHPPPPLGNEVTVETEKVMTVSSKTDKKKEASYPMVKANGEWHSLDLVAMLCYSKLKQKYKGDRSSFGKKLHELVYQGNTTIKIKGKRKIQYTLKIPNCPALRTNTAAPACNNKNQPSENTRMNDFSESTESSALTIELLPLNSNTWEYIQSLSINPRLRLTIPLTRTVGELLEFVGEKWHLPLKGVFQLIRLYKASDLPATLDDHSPLSLTADMTVRQLKDMVADGSHKHKISLQYDVSHHSDSLMASRSGSSFLMALLDFFQSTNASPVLCSPNVAAQSPPPPPHLSQSTPSSSPSHSILTSVATTSTPPAPVSFPPSPSPPPLPPPVVSVPPLSLPPPPPTSKEQTGTDTINPSSSVPVSTHVAITPPPVVPLGVTTGSPPNPKKATPSRSCSTLVFSPTVRQYWESISKKSPLRSVLKSPLQKYKRLSRTCLTSPNSRNSHHQIRKPVKRTRLDFSDISASSATSSTPSSSSAVTRSQSSIQTKQSTVTSSSLGLQKLPSSSTVKQKPHQSRIAPVVYDLTFCRKQQEKGFSLVRLNNEKAKQSNAQKPEKLHHLVTVPKTTFSTGSFSTVRLSNLLQSVQENLKDSESNPKLIQPVTSSLPTPTTSSGTNAIVKTPVTKAVTSVVLQDIASPSELKDAIMATTKTSKEHVPATVTRAQTSVCPPQPQSSVVDPSPLQLYASQVASSQQSKPPSTNVCVTPLSSSTTIVTTSAPMTTRSSLLTTYLDKKLTRRRAILNPSSKHSQRPVIPKPLQYFSNPEMVSLMSSPPNNVATPSIGGLTPMSLLMSSPTTSNTSASLTQQQYGTSFTSPSSSLATANKYFTPRHSAAPNPGSITNETLSTSASALLNSILPPPPPRSSLPPPSLPPSSFLSSLQKAEGPSSTASVSTGAPPQTLNHQALQEQLTSLLLNMLMSQQQQVRLPLQQQQQVQAVLNSLTPSLSIPNASSTTGSFSTSTSQVTTVPAKGIKSSPVVTLPSTVNSDIPSVLEEIPSSSVLPQISMDSVQTSDTVNELLRGLTSSDQQEQQSLKRLSEETVDVLPTFARAMMQMSSSTSTSSTAPVTASTGEQTGPARNEELLLSSQQPPMLSDEGHISNDNSLMQLINDEELVNNTFSDSSLKHIIENADFADMFSQLRDILKTPDKRSSGSASLSSREESNRTSPSSMIPPPPVVPQLQLENEAPPHREVSDIFNSPYKIRSHNESTAVRTLLEDTSVDYINKFREMASAMSQTASQPDFNHATSSSSASSSSS